MSTYESRHCNEFDQPGYISEIYGYKSVEQPTSPFTLGQRARPVARPDVVHLQLDSAEDAGAKKQ